MSKVTVTLAVNLAALLPVANSAFDHTLITLTDSTGAAQQASVNGTESPPWTAEFDNVAAGPGTGTITAQPLDIVAAPIGDPVSTTFTEVGTPPATFPQVVSISAVVA